MSAWALVLLLLACTVAGKKFNYHNDRCPEGTVEHFLEEASSCRPAGFEEDEEALRVAIVGGGVSGAGAAFFLREAFGDRVAIDVYERLPQVGGRLSTVPSGGDWLELGGNRFNQQHDQWTASIVELLGLATAIPSRVGGVFDGEGIADVDAQSELAILAKAQLVRQEFELIYKKQSQGKYFDSVGEMLENIGVDGYYAQSMYQSLGEDASQQDIQQAFALLQASGGRNLSSNALACWLSLQHTNSPGARTVPGGIHKVIDGLLAHSKATILLRSLVSELQVVNAGSASPIYLVYNPVLGLPQSYNAVIFAHPAEKGELEIKGANVKTVPIRKDFSLAVVATVQGEIDCSYFGLDFPCVRDLPSFLTSSNPSAAPFVAFELVGGSLEEEQHAIWKITSPQPLNKTTLDLIFLRHSKTMEKMWQTHPIVDPSDHLHAPFAIDNGLYHINAIESAWSSIEMVLIGAKNVALQVERHFKRQAEASIGTDDPWDILSVPHKQRLTPRQGKLIPDDQREL